MKVGKSSLDLSIVIPSFNTKKLTVDCIKSIVDGSHGIDYEIIVIENASTDGSFEAITGLKGKFGNIKIIRNSENVRFSASNNMGMKISKGRYVLLLNSDTLVKEGVLKRMITFMDGNANIGVASCALKNADGSFQGTGGAFPTLLRVCAWMYFWEDIPLFDRIIKPFHPVHGRSPFYKGNFGGLKPEKRDWVTGAFMMISRDAIRKTGYFDTDYYMYTEEVDYCYRLHKKGFDTYFVPDVFITHFGGASSSAEFPVISEFRGVQTFYKKHMPGWQQPLLKFIMKTGILMRIVLFYLMGDPHVSKIYVKAYSNI